ncbi:7375_t:CDS:2 [Diversispora eburnea]|uniref:7375_t:CDS:1 n=1 Tax=Diversispora eburnea TaxID=1213867 RepID=A0A9N9BLN4_9GLOM|nr:7375_t:CDS:2 [Diversispora eburnea]
MKSNCYVLAIFIFLALGRAFAFTGIFNCKDGAGITNPRWGNDSTNALVLTIDLKSPSPIQAVGNYKVYFYSVGKEANTTESYYVFMHTPDWVNGYTSQMFIPNSGSKWVGANPYSLALTYSPLKFPPSGTLITVGATVHYGCSLNGASDLVCNYCPMRVYTKSP